VNRGIIAIFLVLITYSLRAQDGCLEYDAEFCYVEWSPGELQPRIVTTRHPANNPLLAKYTTPITLCLDRVMVGATIQLAGVFWCDFSCLPGESDVECASRFIEEALAKAVSEINNACPNDILQYVVGNPGCANVDQSMNFIVVAPFPYDSRWNRDNRWVVGEGFASRRSSTGGVIAGQVLFNTAALFLDIQRNGDKEACYTLGDVNNYRLPDGRRMLSLPTVLMHEICHSLGLAHYDACNTAGNLDQELMYSIYTDQHQYARLTCHAACSLKRLFCPDHPVPPDACALTGSSRLDREPASGMEIYPTIVNGYITIDTRDMELEEYMIVNLEGVVVVRGSVRSSLEKVLVLDLGRLSAGNYYFVTFSSNRIESRLIKVIH
jgi:hypothetical protein